MSTIQGQRVTTIPGRIVLNPTNMSAAFPYSGTVLGSIRSVRFEPGLGTFSVIAEEWGIATQNYYKGETGRLLAVMRELDNDLLTHLFRGDGAGATTGGREVSPTVLANAAGAAVPDSVIYFAPYSDAHHGVILYRAKAMVQEAGAINFSNRAEVGLAVAWEALPDATGRPYQIARKEDIVL